MASTRAEIDAAHARIERQEGLLALEALSDTESDRRATLEEVVDRGRATFIEVGEALQQIRDERLYRSTHTAFGDYLQDRWGMSRRQGYRLIDAAAVAGLVTEVCPTGHTGGEDDWRARLAEEFGGVAEPPSNEEWEKKHGGARAKPWEERRAEEVLGKAEQEEAEVPPPKNERVARRLAATAATDPERAKEIWRQTVQRYGPDATSDDVAQVANGAVPSEVAQDAKRCASAIRKAVKDRDPKAAKQALAIWRASVYGELDRIARTG